jgi:GNAT superfamily N-acetyltransferase
VSDDSPAQKPTALHVEAREAGPVESVVVRDAELADVDVLRDVFRRASLSNEHDRPHLLARPELLEWANDSVGEGRTRVAVVEGRVVGFITTASSADGLEVDDLFVDPRWTRRGIGRALVIDIAASARAGGIRRLTVEANDHALRFDGRVGFVTHGVAETPFGSASSMADELVPGVPRGS